MRRLLPIQLAGATLSTALLLGCTTQPPDVYGDLVITNARVYTFTWSEPALDGTPAPDAPHDPDASEAAGWSPDAEAVVVDDGVIVFVGTAEQAQRYVGPETEILDAAGATVLPGLVDSHTHVAGLGELAVRVDLVGVETEEEAVALVEQRAAETPPGQWILGRGWDEGAWANRYPTMDLLSERVPDHPVLLDSLHGFAVWGNRLAFERAGIDGDTADPDGGEILRNRSGDPSGVVLNRAGPLLRAAVPEPTDEQIEEFLRAGLEQMARDGYVAVHEAGVGSRQMAALERMEAAGELPIRVYAMLSARDAAVCEEWLERGPRSGRQGMLAVRSVKAYYDGALGSRGARLLDDYSDLPGHRGTSGSEYGFDQDLVRRMMTSGFQVGIHAIGDAGNRETLDFIERVVAETPGRRPNATESNTRRSSIPMTSRASPSLASSPRWSRPTPSRTWPGPKTAWARSAFAAPTPGGPCARPARAHLQLRSRRLRPQTSSTACTPPSPAATRSASPPKAGTPERADDAGRSRPRLHHLVGLRRPLGRRDRHPGARSLGRLTVMDIDPLALGESDPGALLDGEDRRHDRGRCGRLPGGPSRCRSTVRSLHAARPRRLA